jgi:hypothetical protein
MSSQLNAFIATSHRVELHREAERTRQPEDRAAAENPGASENPFPTILRSRRFGRIVRIVPSSERRAA